MVASHVLEHLANPVGALLECTRVVKIGGRILIIMPDRHLTFDSPRVPNSAQHLIDEYHKGVKEVDVPHLIDFLAAIYEHPPILPTELHEMHNPANLSSARVTFHRQRSIHVHVWNPEEFAVLLVAIQLEGLASWRLQWTYVVDDVPEGGIEFGLLLESLDPTLVSPSSAAEEFIRQWSAQFLAEPARSASRTARFGGELLEQLGDAREVRTAVQNIVLDLADNLIVREATAASSLRAANLRADALRLQTDALTACAMDANDEIARLRIRVAKLSDRIKKLRSSKSYRLSLAIGKATKQVRSLAKW